MRRTFPIIAALLAYLMVPGSVEIVENLGHWITHGDTAHADRQHDQDGPSDEHGCSGTYHACSCHASASFVAGSGAPVLMAPVDRPARAPRAINEAHDSDFVRQLLRPPRATA